MKRRLAALAAAVFFTPAPLARAEAATETLPPGWSLSEGDATSNEDGVLRLFRARHGERGCDVYVSRADGSHAETKALAKAQGQEVFMQHVTFRKDRCVLRNPLESAKSGIRLVLSEIPLPR